MKRILFRRAAVILSFFVIATQFSLPVYAIGGTDGQEINSAITSDDTGTIKYDEQGNSISTTETITSNEAPVKEVEVTNLSTAVTETNVGEVVASDVEDATVESAKGLVNEAVDELIGDTGNQTVTEAADTVETAGENIDNQIGELNSQLESVSATGGDSAAKIYMFKKKIRFLQELKANLRAKAIIEHKNLAEKIRKVKNMPAVYEVRWGDLNMSRELCAGVSIKELIEALKNNDLPENCNLNQIQYTGKISVDRGTLKVRNEVLFEANDKVTVSEGNTIEFNSTIASHWDGLIVEYIPASDEDGTKNEVNVTISLGDLNGTFTGSTVTGRKDIGNDDQLEIKRIAFVLPIVAAASQSEIIDNKLAIENKISTIQNKIYRLRLLKKANAPLDALESAIDEAGEYNFDETGTTEVESEINTTTQGLMDDTSAEAITAKADELKNKIAVLKEQSRLRKFVQKLIPFRDTDDSEWYTNYVSTVKSEGIISGYKDAAGNELGEFRPANNITIAEILKIALETADKGTTDGVPTLVSAVNHWAKGYVKKAEELDLNIVSANVDLNRPATRGEVIRIVLEALGITPDDITSTSFSDVPAGNVNAKFIEYAKKLGIISGDAGKTTFRPDAPINRAEAAKIASQIIEIILGGTSQ